YALRFSIVACIGYIIGLSLPDLLGSKVPLGNNGYWVVLTMMVILKPGFSVTKKRNYQRVLGTIIGGTIGGLILYLIPNQDVRFIFMVFFMVICYSTQRIYYFISVITMTPFVLIMFSFVSTLSSQNIIFERVI